MARVMVVDDDVTVREVVVTYLRAAGYDVGEAADGEAALDGLRDERADLVVLDLMLPGIDGLEVCRRIRAKGDDVPVIMLTALGSETDRVVGLERGADDYVTKPFSPRELVLRVESVLRRVGGAGHREGLGGGRRPGRGLHRAHREPRRPTPVLDRARVRPAAVPGEQPRAGVLA